MNLRFILLGCVLTASVNAQQLPDISLAEKFSGDRLNSYVENSLLSPVWIENSNLFYFSVNSSSGNIYYLVDADKSKKTTLVTASLLAEKLSNLLAEPVDEKKLRITPIINPKNPDLFEFLYKQKNYQFHVKKQTLTEIPLRTEEKKSFGYTSGSNWQKFSDDSTWFAYGYRHDIYLQRRNTNDSFRITFDGEPFYSFVNSNATSTDDRKTIPFASWLKNSNKMVALREDKRQVGEMAVINSLAKNRPEVSNYKFPMPGDKNVVQYELFLIDAATQSLKKVSPEKYKDQRVILQSTLVNGRMPLHAGQISESEKFVYFLLKNRTNDRINLYRLDAETGQVKELISETCKPHFNEQLFTCRILNNGADIIWWSERSGKGAYYIYDGEGNLKNTIGEGSFVAGEIHSIDTAKRSFIFEAYGYYKNIDPYYKMYFEASFDKKGKVAKNNKNNGSNFQVLTPGNGYHDIQISPSGKYLIDTYSTMNQPPVHVLRNKSGEQLLKLAESNIDSLLLQGWKMPEMFSIKAPDDSTLLYGVMYKPFNFDSTRKYPVISNVYPGPQEDVVSRRFTVDDNYNQSLAQLGYIVVTVGHRGSSPLRGKAFHCFGYGNLRDYALADDKEVLEKLAITRPYMDLNKVGIYGHSGGGFMSATALLTYPDFYKVAVAASGNYDSNIYTQWWGETYHGLDSTEKGFSVNIPSTLDLAGNLKGKLLLVTGDVDKNVHPAHTFRLADALIKKEKYFDMMVLPGKDHGLGDKYYINMIRYYFLNNLR